MSDSKNGPGLRFNQVGRDEPAKEVLVPRLDPGVRRRTYVIVALAIVAISLLFLVSINRFGVEQTSGSNNGGTFRREEPRIDK